MKFLVLLAITFSFIGCSCEEPEYPITGPNGAKFRVLSPAIEPSPENGYIGRVEAYKKEGDDTRWIQVRPGHFVDTHVPISDDQGKK